MLKNKSIVTKKIYRSIDNINLELNIYKPSNWSKNDKRSAIIFFFGGGWIKGNIDHFKPHSEYLSSKGMVAITVDYRVKNRHGTTPFDCVEDGKYAVAYVKNNHKELGIDTKKIVVGGGSAGGHVAACTVLINDNEFIEQKVSLIPSAMVLFNPVLDTTENGYGSEKIAGNSKNLSPVHHIRENLPPTIIFHGTDDNTVPFSNSKTFYNKMLENGNDCTLIPYRGKDHGFFNKGSEKDNFSYIDTLKRTENFLRSLKYI